LRLGGSDDLVSYGKFFRHVYAKDYNKVQLDIEMSNSAQLRTLPNEAQVPSPLQVGHPLARSSEALISNP
jgi:hypothetical protein